MQWSRIKTLFILCFLLLDVYLLIQFLNKQDQYDYESYEEQQSTIEESLELENITIPSDLPKKQLEESYIQITSKVFNEEEIDTITDIDNQVTKVINNNFIVSQFEQPVPLPKTEDKKEIEGLVKSFIPFPEDYKYWGWNKDYNVLIFSQVKEGRPVYLNQSGTLLVFLNKNNEMIFYSQTMLGEAEKFENSLKTLIAPIRAIGNLYYRGDLYSEDEVDDVDIGYYTAISLKDGKQTLAPTWTISVNNERNYFVNAIEGYVYSGDEIQFLEDSIEAIITAVRTIQDEDDLKEPILDHLIQKLEVHKRSETEHDITF